MHWTTGSAGALKDVFYVNPRVKRGDKYGRFGNKHNQGFISGASAARHDGHAHAAAQSEEVDVMRLAGGKDYFTEEELDEADVYFENQLSTLAEDDILSGEEEGFMMGYLAAF